MKRIFNLIIDNKFECIVAICMFSNLYPNVLPDALYYLSIPGVAFSMIRCGIRSTPRTLPTLVLIGVIALSSFIAGSLNMRALSMCFMLLAVMAWSSESFYHFKYRLLFFCLLAFAFTSIINFYAKNVGINYYNAVQIYNWGSSSGEFSGFTCHPMWMSAACGIGTIFFVYAMIVLYKRGHLQWTIFFGLVSLASLWTTMQGGSRSASGIALLCCLFLILVSFQSATQKRKILIPIILIGLLAIPTMVTDNEQFKRKQGGIGLYDDQGKTSRTDLWQARWDEFKSAPVFGIGFGVQKEGYENSTETGSGWLTALAQTGLIGFSLICFLVYKVKLTLNDLRTDSTAALFEAVMLFLLLHSFFEAYMFQIGWYMCLFFWLLLSVLDDYKTYDTMPDMETELFGESINDH